MALYGEKLRSICEKLGIDSSMLKDRLFSTLLDAIEENCSSGGSGGGSAFAGWVLTDFADEWTPQYIYIYDGHLRATTDPWFVPLNGTFDQEAGYLDSDTPYDLSVLDTTKSYTVYNVDGDFAATLVYVG